MEIDCSLQRRFAAFVVADADGVVDVADKDFAVADAAGAGRADDGLKGFFLHVVVDHKFDLHLGQKIDRVFAAAVKLGVALLTAMAAGFENGHAFNARFEQGILHYVQLGWLQNRFNFGHTENASFDSLTGEGAGCASPLGILIKRTRTATYVLKS